MTHGATCSIYLQADSSVPDHSLGTCCWRLQALPARWSYWGGAKGDMVLAASAVGSALVDVVAPPPEGSCFAEGGQPTHDWQEAEYAWDPATLVRECHSCVTRTFRPSHILTSLRQLGAKRDTPPGSAEGRSRDRSGREYVCRVAGCAQAR